METFTRPQNTQPNPRPSHEEPSAAPTRSTKVAANSSNNKKIAAVVGVVLIVFLLLGAIWFGQSALAGGSPTPDKNKYQALFLTNGQVYFGKLSDTNKEYVKISDIYYLQVQQAVQPEQQPAEGQQQEQPQTSLVKLGNELHGPQDEMYVAKSQVLFWENLKDDGKVVKAIQENQNKE